MQTLDQLEAAITRHSIRLNHFYWGVEHLFLALLDIPDGYLTRVLNQHQLTAAHVARQIIETVGKTPYRLYWEGFRTSPRLDTVIQLATRENANPTERDLLKAIADEGESLSIWILGQMGLDVETLRANIAQWTSPPDNNDPAVTIESALPLSKLEQTLLRRLFPTEASITVLHEPSRPTAHARCLIVRMADEGRAVVRFAHTDSVLQEISQLGQHGMPTRVSQFAAEHDAGAIRYDLPEAKTSTPDGAALEEPLFDTLWTRHPKISMARVEALVRQLPISQPADSLYHFPIWREYEFLLPPALVVEQQAVDNPQTLSPLQDWAIDGSIATGTAVALVDFTINRIVEHRGYLSLAAGSYSEAINHASQVWVTDIPQYDIFAKGELAPTLEGVVSQTRRDLLIAAAKALDPGFGVDGEKVRTPLGVLVNPIDALPKLLAYPVDGALAPIHGKLNLHNMIVDHFDDVTRIDFAQARLGHTLLDWITLEASLIETTLERLSDDWINIWDTASLINKLNIHYAQAPSDDTIFLLAIPHLKAVRERVAAQLGDPADWCAYFAGQVCFYLGVMAKPSISQKVRRVAFALAIITTNLFFEVEASRQNKTAG